MPRKKILIVDDDRETVQLLSLALRPKGYKIAIAFDGVEGLEQVEKAKPDLILLDINMPRIDGSQVQKILRSNPRTAEIPVILMTVKEMVKDVEEGMERGARAYFAKPFDIERLLKKVDELLK